MSPVEHRSRKHDRRTRQDRGKSNRLAAKQHLKTERRCSSSPQSNSLQPTVGLRSYNLRSSHRRCSQSDIQPKEQPIPAKHCSVCTGKSEARKLRSPLANCIHCNRKSHVNNFQSTTNNNESIDSPRTTSAVCRECRPEDFPDLDFHHSFGSFLTRRSPVLDSVDQDLGRYWALLNKSPATLQHHIHHIGDRYRDAFRRFFTAEPISLHGHVSDASSPALLTSLISHLASCSSPCGDNLFFGAKDKINPCIAILEGSYGAGFGPLAHDSVLDFVRPLANGKPPVVVTVHESAKIDHQVRIAKRAGCVALIAEMVRARDGVVISQTAWKLLLRACKKYNLVLVVDEALTAIRCGAPFAHQLPQYQRHGLPDLVLFGKALKTNGIAVDWRGINMHKLGITDPDDRLFTVLQWQERLTEMAPAASLLTSWGTLVLAEREQWPRRAHEIGRIIRGLIHSEGIESTLIGGLNSLLYLRAEDQARLRSPVMGANAGKYVRWFPMMDAVMTSEEELRTKVFGPSSIPHRREVAAYLISQGLRLGFCSRCGQAVEADLRPSCGLCVVEVCEDCEPEVHTCPMEGMSG